MNPGYETRSIASEPDHHTTALIEACGLPEIGTELIEKSVRVASSLDRPFTVAGSVVTIRHDIAADFWDSACALREAVELHAIGGDELRWAHRIVAHATAAVYGATMLRRPAIQESRSRLVMPELGRTLLPGGYDVSSVASDTAEFLELRDGLDPCPRGEIRAAARALPLAAPTEVLLTLGGDHRQRVDWDTGANSYGLSPRPVPWKTQFGSCTASSPSPRAFAAARELRHDLVASAIDDVLDDAVEQVAQDMRRTILKSFGLTDVGNVEVVLTPSGTDAEYVSLVLAMSREGILTSIVLAPSEIGSGSLWAASGKHFSQLSPFGSGHEPGTPLRGIDHERIHTRVVEVRTSDGALRSPEDVESEIRGHIEDSQGPVLLHAVEGTKTGIRLPRIETLRAWSGEFGQRLTVVVDAAQVRIDQSTVEAHVRDDRIVFVTGSKFFGGPPFSGAVFIPRQVAERAHRLGPEGLSEYLSRYDVPKSLDWLREAVGPIPNYGLLVRWAAAIAEITSFLNTSPGIRDEILRRLAKGIRDIIDSSAHLRLVESPFTAIPAHDDRGLDDLPTIFSFLVLDHQGRAFDMEAARRIFALLVADLSNEDALNGDPGMRQLARQTFHLGQPVGVSQPGGEVAGALRIAIGAPTLSQIVFDVSRGQNWMDRLDLEIADIHAAIEKVAVIIRLVDSDDPRIGRDALAWPALAESD